MAARLDAPVLGAENQYHGPDKYDVSFTWRSQKSDRHFTGSHADRFRQYEDSEVINRIQQPELTLRRNYGANNRWSLSVGIPYLMATRSGSLRDSQGRVIGRQITDSRGIGDITLTARRWVWDPAKHSNFNISAGLGIKIPTGADDVVSTRRRVVNNVIVSDTNSRVNDQSIQPGDGGFGIIVDGQSYARFGKGKWVWFLTGTYLLNPGNTNGVPTGRGPGEEIMSIADQYLARTGVAWFPGSGKIGLSIAERIEGVPTYDRLGKSDGFRRPGYAVSVEPGISYTRGAHTFSLSVAKAGHRTRARNTADLAHLPQYGDAAFADYVVFGGYFRKF